MFADVETIVNIRRSLWYITDAIPIRVMWAGQCWNGVSAVPNGIHVHKDGRKYGELTDVLVKSYRSPTSSAAVKHNLKTAATVLTERGYRPEYHTIQRQTEKVHNSAVMRQIDKPQKRKMKLNESMSQLVHATVAELDNLPDGVLWIDSILYADDEDENDYINVPHLTHLSELIDAYLFDDIDVWGWSKDDTKKAVYCFWWEGIRDKPSMENWEEGSACNYKAW